MKPRTWQQPQTRSVTAPAARLSKYKYRACLKAYVSAIPETQKQHNDIVDILLQSCTVSVPVQQTDETIVMQERLDNRALWWKSLNVSTTILGKYAHELRSFVALAQYARQYLTPEVGDQLARDILEFVEPYYTVLDAKSSESMRDAKSAQSTVLSMIGKHRVEQFHHVETNQQAKTVLGNLFGGKKHDEDQGYSAG